MRNNLIDTRNENEMTQTELAKKINTCVRNYQYLESGKTNGSMKIWITLSSVLEKPIDYLMQNTQ